ncbi:MAG: hypothetical protein A2V81_01815 [Candidatus Abawacabacteria bacterium RBG_16_42_10]|uniref:Uncharacterized protein n=1 Tax=Candidatus Abawacabacteria bacterium RBG_16_42_10 TaxID=1817814 RepID=A0A1F4XJD8_9BACT|nr:MAG: hypothetical protein A2V81_01815 [Candidatus Abawacabacteria bacterium RBG_16_42_10]
MVSESKARKFIKSQQSLHLYKKVQRAFVDVLQNFSESEFNTSTKNLILMVLHEGALGQVMHFPSTTQKFQIMQLTIPKSMPISIMRYVIAHEFGHVMQCRNWRKSDGSKLEDNADSWAKKWGFHLKPSYKTWMATDRLIKSKYRAKE